MNLIISFVGNLDCLSLFAKAHAYISVPEEPALRIVDGQYHDIRSFQTGISELTLYEVDLPESFLNRNDIHLLTITSDELEDYELEAFPVHAVMEDANTHKQTELILPDLNVYIDARFVVHSPIGMSPDKFIDMVKDLNTPYDTILQFPLKPNDETYVSGYVKAAAIDRYYYDTETTLKELVQFVVDHPDERNAFDIYPYFFTEGEFIIAKITFDA